MLKAQEQSLRVKQKITLSKGQKEELLGIGNLSMVDSGRHRTREIKKASPEDKAKFAII